MKRRALIRHLRKHGCELLREGGRHSIYWHPQSEKTVPVPRHAEIADLLARHIFEELGIPAPGEEQSKKGEGSESP
jgi:mRNA interferase HicA